MQINVSQQLKATVGSIRDYEVSETLDIEGSNNAIHGNVRLMRTDRGILVEGKLHTDIELTCSRCLSVFKCTLAINIEEEYFPTTDIISGNSLPIPDEPGSFTIDEHNILDLTEAIRQYLIMAIPMKPLCQQDCSGLCPVCGINLNKLSCNCHKLTADPRWSKLSEIASSTGASVLK